MLASRQRRAWHEAGHAVVAEHLGLRVDYATVRTFFSAAGAVLSEVRPLTDIELATRRMGGVAAELVIYGAIEPGCETDLALVSHLPRKTIEQAIENAKSIVVERRARLDEIARALIKFGSIDGNLRPLKEEQIAAMEERMRECPTVNPKLYQRAA